MTQAFLVDEATGETVQRLGAPDIGAFLTFPLEAGQQIVPYFGQDDIEDLETYLGQSGAVYLRTRTFDPSISLQLARISKRAAILARRDRAEWSGCDTTLGRVDSDPDSQRKVNGSVTMALVAQAAGIPFTVKWTMQNNTPVIHDGPAMVAMGLAVGQHVSDCHAHALALKAAVDSAADLETLEAIDIDSGWPGNA